MCIMEVFIEKIKQHPCLWKMNDVSYRDLEKKDLLWERVARKSGMTSGKEAKAQWKKLRDSHREALRRRKISTAHAAQNLRPWKYEALMKFLLTQTENSETSSNYSCSLQETRYDAQNSSDANPNDYNVIESPPPPSESPLSTSSAVQSEVQKRNSKQLELFTEVQHREKNREQRRTERNELRRNMIDINRPQDALSNLFASLCQKTRELPKYLQLRVQREIFESITRAEEEALSLDSLNTYYSGPPSTSSSYGYPSTTQYKTSPMADALTDTEMSVVKAEQ